MDIHYNLEQYLLHYTTHLSHEAIPFLADSLKSNKHDWQYLKFKLIYKTCGTTILYESASYPKHLEIPTVSLYAYILITCGKHFNSRKRPQ